MKKNKLISISLVILLVIGIVFIVSKYSIKGSNSESNIKKEQLGNILSKTVFADNGNIELGKEMFGDDIIDYSESINKGDFEESIKIADKIINNIDSKSDSDISFDLVNSKLSNKENKKIVLTAAKYLKASALLNHGNYYYKEKESGDKADKILSEVQIVDESLLNNPYGMYFLGYSKEIKKEYSKAIEYYNKGIEYTKDDNKLLAVFYNQIGHVYDLSGDMMKAYEFYLKAYNENKDNINVLINIGRKLVGFNKFKEALPYFEYGLNTTSPILKSEIYYSLSSIELELNGLKPNINKSIEYAKKGIESFPKYPMNYVALARGYYMLNDSKYYKEIEDNLNLSIKLNPNGYLAYEIYGLYMFDKGDIEKSGFFLLKSIETVDKDVILMQNERINLKNRFKNVMNFLILVLSAKKDNVTMDKLGKTFEKIQFGNQFIRLQLSRKSYGLFDKINGVEEFSKSFTF